MSIVQTQADMDQLVDVIHTCMKKVIPSLIARIETLEGGGGSQGEQRGFDGRKAFERAKKVATALQARNNERIIADTKAKMVRAATSASAARRAGRPLPSVKFM